MAITLQLQKTELCSRKLTEQKLTSCQIIEQDFLTSCQTDKWPETNKKNTRSLEERRDKKQKLKRRTWIMKQDLSAFGQVCRRRKKFLIRLISIKNKPSHPQTPTGMYFQVTVHEPHSCHTFCKLLVIIFISDETHVKKAIFSYLGYLQGTE